MIGGAVTSKDLVLKTMVLLVIGNHCLMTNGFSESFAMVFCRISNKFRDWEGLELLDAPSSARANLGCQGQFVVPRSIRGARASLGCQGQPGVPGPVRGARASSRCQSQSGMPGPIRSARASPGCPSQSGV